MLVSRWTRLSAQVGYNAEGLWLRIALDHDPGLRDRLVVLRVQSALACVERFV